MPIDTRTLEIVNLNEGEIVILAFKDCYVSGGDVMVLVDIVQTIAQKPPRKIIFDFNRAAQVDYGSVTAFAKCLQVLSEAGVAVCLCRMTEAVHMCIEMCIPTHTLQIVYDLEAALLPE